MCGKDSYLYTYAIRSLGSPPRVREGHNYFFDSFVGFRITPACAGRTGELVGIYHKYKDHPRVCGKDYCTISEEKNQKGSPPRVREGPSKVSIDPTSQGITPACAGRTFKVVRRFGFTKDHPRVCGKDLLFFYCYYIYWDHPRVCGKDVLHRLTLHKYPGSPPRVREGLKITTEILANRRITPACAGRTPQ